MKRDKKIYFVFITIILLIIGITSCVEARVVPAGGGGHKHVYEYVYEYKNGCKYIKSDKKYHYKKCKICSQELKEEHEYTYYEGKTIDHKYHYGKCKYCSYEIKEKHVLDKNGKCKKCKAIHGKGEIDKTKSTSDNHYYKCKNKNCKELIQERHNYKGINAVGNHIYHIRKCACGATKQQKHNINGKEKCTICKEKHSKTNKGIYTSDKNYHYYNCSSPYCDGRVEHEYEISAYSPENKNELNHEYHYIRCKANGCYEYTEETHTFDKNGKCKKCKKTHKVTKEANNNNVSHIIKCTAKKCSYDEKKESHESALYEKDGKCKICGRTWTQCVKQLQGKLYDLGYYEGIYSSKKKAADGKVGKNTISALNDFLTLQGKNVTVGSDGKISKTIFAYVQNATKKKKKILEEQNEKMLKSLKENDILINALCKENSTQKQIANILLNSNVDNLNVNEIKKKISSFDIAVLMCLYSNNDYDSSLRKRNDGREDINTIFKNPPRTNEETYKVLNELKNNRIYFDCSSFASTVMSLGYNISCGPVDSSFTTKDFEDNRKTVFKTKKQTNKQTNTLKVKDLKKGDLLLSRRSDDQPGHIIVSLGGEKAIHTNTGGKPIRYVNLNDEGQKYLTTKGEFKNVYILKH